MSENNPGVVVGVFPDPDQARQAVDELLRAGFGEDQVGVVARAPRPESEAEVRRQEADWNNSQWEKGAATGMVTGAGLGALWGLAVAAGALPVVGPVIAGGVLGSVLLGAAGGALGAGVVGTLVGMGLPDPEARYYDSEFQAGRSLVTVRAAGRTQEAADLLRRCGATNLNTPAGAEDPGRQTVRVPVNREEVSPDPARADPSERPA